MKSFEYCIVEFNYTVADWKTLCEAYISYNGSSDWQTVDLNEPPVRESEFVAKLSQEGWELRAIDAGRYHFQRELSASGGFIKSPSSYLIGD